jgi:hypothetical protein
MNDTMFNFFSVPCTILVALLLTIHVFHPLLQMEAKKEKVRYIWTVMPFLWHCDVN